MTSQTLRESCDLLRYHLTSSALPLEFDHFGERWTFFLIHVAESRQVRCMFSNLSPNGWLLASAKTEAETLHCIREVGFTVPRRGPLHALMERAVAAGIAMSLTTE